MQQYIDTGGAEYMHACLLILTTQHLVTYQHLVWIHCDVQERRTSCEPAAMFLSHLIAEPTSYSLSLLIYELVFRLPAYKFRHVPLFLSSYDSINWSTLTSSYNHRRTQLGIFHLFLPFGQELLVIDTTCDVYDVRTSSIK